MNLFNRIKFAAAVFDKNPEVQKLYKSGQLKFASEIDQPAKRPDVETTEAINAFMKRNPVEKAGGGRIGFAEKGFVPGSGPDTGSALEAEVNIKKVKAALNKIKKRRNNKNLFEWSENSDWYRKLQKDLGGMKDKGLNREYTNKLINQVIEEFFPGSYHGKNAIKNFRNDMVVKSFIQHLKSVGEFDGQEKFDKVLDQFTYTKDGKRKDKMHLYEDINRSWKSWIKGEFEVDGIDRAQLKKELKARGIDYSQIDDWKAAQTQKRGTDKIAEIKFLDNQNNKFPNRSLEQVEELFKKKFPNGNFYLRVNNLTELKNTGVYVSGATSERSIVGINKGNRATWLKKAYGKQFAGNYSKIINAADQLVAAGETTKAKRLYEAADKFFGPNGIIRKSAVGEAEHALARSFDFLNPDRQLAINSIVSGDLNQFKKNLFDIPVKRYFDEYNNLETTKSRRVQLKNLIEERKKIMNAITGGQKKGIVAGDIVNFRYGDNKITATSSVKPIDTLFKEGKFNIDDYIQKGNKYTEAFQEATKNINIKQDFNTPVNEAKLKKLISAIGCDPKASGGRVGYNEGEICFSKGVDAINNNKIKTQAQAKNFEKLLKVGRNITKYGIIPEALFVTGESLIRMGLGDNPKEALLRASEYLLPGDQTKIADRSMYTRLLNENAANILEKVNTYKNAQNKLENIKQQKENASNLTTTSDLDYFTQTQKDVDKYYNPLIKKQEAEIEKFKRPSAEMIYAKRMQDEATDIRTANNAITKLKKLSKDMAMDDDIYNIEQLQAPSVKVDATLFPDYKKAMSSDKARNELQFMSFPDEVIKEFAKENNMNADELLLTKNALKQIYSIDNAANVFGPEQVYGASGTVGTPVDLDMSNLTEPTSSRYEGFSPRFNTYNPMAGGGIAGLSGGDKSGPAPESGPQSQGLQGLMNRVKNR